MAPLRILFAGLCVVAAALPDTGAASTSSSSDNFSDTHIDENGQTFDVADPFGDPNESDSIQQDSRAEWQSDLVNGLYVQRRAEKDFNKELESDANDLTSMLDNITIAFKLMESARQQKGYEMIVSHFKNEVKLLNQSQHEILSDLSTSLTVGSSDSDALKSLKTQVMEIIAKKFKEQILNVGSLFKEQMGQIKKEHAKQIVHVKTLFDLIYGWKDAFRADIKKSARKLAKIAQSWDLL